MFQLANSNTRTVGGGISSGVNTAVNNSVHHLSYFLQIGYSFEMDVIDKLEVKLTSNLQQAYLWKDVLYMMDPVCTGRISHFIDSQPFKLLIHHKRVSRCMKGNQTNSISIGFLDVIFRKGMVKDFLDVMFSKGTVSKLK